MLVSLSDINYGYDNLGRENGWPVRKAKIGSI